MGAPGGNGPVESLKYGKIILIKFKKIRLSDVLI
jgi:hypothetical protein